MNANLTPEEARQVLADAAELPEGVYQFRTDALIQAAYRRAVRAGRRDYSVELLSQARDVLIAEVDR